MRRESIALIPGQRFGRYAVVRRVDCRSWLCVCDCGNTQRVYGASLVGGRVSGCRACRQLLRGLVSRKCVICSNEFSPYHEQAISCSEACSSERKRRVERIRHPTKQFQPVECSVCTIKFTPRDGKQICCSAACFTVRKQELAHERNERKTFRLASCVVCAKEFRQRRNINVCSEECRVAWRGRRHQRYYQANVECLRIKNAIHRDKNREYYRLASREWAKAHPDQVRRHSQNSVWRDREKRLQKFRSSETALSICKSLNIELPEGSRSQLRHAAYMALRELGLLETGEVK